MKSQKNLKDKKILITCGGTREYIDPVRFIGNWSTGLMGFYLAKKAQKQGAKVTLICANCHFPDLPSSIKQIKVVTSDEVKKAVIDNLKNQNVLIMAAAVSDFRPEKISDQKIKKGDRKEILLKLKKTSDILFEVKKWREKNPEKKLTVVGFAAETEDLEKNALDKMKKKNLDIIVANKVPESFGNNSAIYQIFLKDSKKSKSSKSSKKDLAKVILKKLISLQNKPIH